MPTPQQPIGSGFGFDTTAAKVLAGIDLADTLAIVTGRYSGIGIEPRRALAAAGATVIIPARRRGEFGGARAESTVAAQLRVSPRCRFGLPPAVPDGPDGAPRYRNARELGVTGELSFRAYRDR